MSAFVKSLWRKITGGVIEGVAAKYYHTTYIVKTQRISYLQSYAVDFFHTQTI